MKYHTLQVALQRKQVLVLSIETPQAEWETYQL
jgi:hypothetical protein